MNNENIINLAFLFFCIAFLIEMLIMVGVIFCEVYCSYKYERDYKLCVINYISSNPQKRDEELMQALLTEFTRYRNRRVNQFLYYDIYALNSHLISDLRTEEYKKYYKSKIKNNDIANKLERIDKRIQSSAIFENEELNKIVSSIENIKQSTDKSEAVRLAEQTKNLFEKCIAWCNGRLFEKEAKIQTLEFENQKLGSRKWWSNFIGIIGFVSSIITIVAWINGLF